MFYFLPQETTKKPQKTLCFFVFLCFSLFFHMAVSGEPQHKVVLKLSTSTLGFFEEFYQYTRK